MDQDTKAPSNEEGATSIITLTTHLKQRRNAIIIGLVITGIDLVCLPFTRTSLVVIEPFVPIFITTVFIIDLITAFLFLSQFFVDRRPAIAVLAMTYLASGLFTIPYIFSFPGLFAESGLFGANSQTTSWLWNFWHILFPSGILLYVSTDILYSKVRLSPKESRNLLIGLLLVVIAIITLLSLIAYNNILPVISENGDFSRLNSSGIGPMIILINGLTFAVLVNHTRGRTVAQLWLSLGVLAWLLDVLLNLLGGSRFSLGWYMGRINTIFTSFIVLMGLLYEVNQLYHKIVRQERELQEALDAQKALDLLKNQFISIASHELRTPLTSIRGYSQLLQRNLFRQRQNGASSDPEAQFQLLEKAINANQHVVHQTDRMSELINRLLDFSRIENGRLELNLIPDVNLARLVEQIVEQQQVGVEHHQLKLLDHPATLLISCDEARLEQVLNNLISNAFKYSPQNTLIEVSLTHQKDTNEAIIAVRDEGQGISPEQQALIFEQFYRVRSSQSMNVDGLGLGLFISREIVDQHGGRIWLESEPEHGSTFFVALPLQPEIAPEEPEKTTPFSQSL